MKKQKMGIITMPFREQIYDSEGNPVIDKNTGKPKTAIVFRIVRHNATYRVK